MHIFYFSGSFPFISTSYCIRPVKSLVFRIPRTNRLLLPIFIGAAAIGNIHREWSRHSKGKFIRKIITRWKIGIFWIIITGATITVFCRRIEVLTLAGRHTCIIANGIHDSSGAGSCRPFQNHTASRIWKTKTGRILRSHRRNRAAAAFNTGNRITRRPQPNWLVRSKTTVATNIQITIIPNINQSMCYINRRTTAHNRTHTILFTLFNHTGRIMVPVIMATTGKQPLNCQLGFVVYVHTHNRCKHQSGFEALLCLSHRQELDKSC